MGELKFAGDGGMDARINKSATVPTGSGSGTGGSGVKFAGDGAQDASGGSTDTSQHDPSENSPSQSGRGVDFTAEG